MESVDLPSPETIEQWISQLQHGDEAPVAELFRLYFRRVEEYIRPMLAGISRGAAGEEDAAQEAFKSFIVRLMDGRLLVIDEPDRLWRALRRIARHKALNLQRHEEVEQRALRAREWNFPTAEAPLPEQILLRNDMVERVLKKLDPEQRRLVECRLLSMTNFETGRRLRMRVRTVERKWSLIRKLFGRHGKAEDEGDRDR